MEYKKLKLIYDDIVSIKYNKEQLLDKHNITNKEYETIMNTKSSLMEE